MKETPNDGVPTVNRAMRSDDSSEPDDPRLTQALEEYVAAMDAGHRPERQSLLAK